MWWRLYGLHSPLGTTSHWTNGLHSPVGTTSHWTYRLHSPMGPIFYCICLSHRPGQYCCNLQMTPAYISTRGAHIALNFNNIFMLVMISALNWERRGWGEGKGSIQYLPCSIQSPIWLCLSLFFYVISVILLAHSSSHSEHVGNHLLYSQINACNSSTNCLWSLSPTLGYF